ncbi:MAG: hypothetical protein Q4E43_02420 [Akkermansia sp.]|nr:hypothetical protein [Akkermansia sp.]
MWRANKWGIIALLIGGAVLFGFDLYLRPRDRQLADQVLTVGVCSLLFVVALASWISARKDI